MSRLFGRSRTTSAVTKQQHLPAPSAGTDEFGRVNSRGSALSVTQAGGSSKKDKKQAKDKEKEKARSKTLPAHPGDRHAFPTDDSQDLPPLPDGVFLSTTLTPPPPPEDGPVAKDHEYGHLATEAHVVLGLDDVSRLVHVVSEQLVSRGLTTPLLFSSLALDINPSLIKRLVTTFLRTCPAGMSLPSYDAKWMEEAQFAGPHELAMLLRWGLARVIRLERGVEVRGLISWDSYTKWRAEEAAAKFPPAFLDRFLTSLPAPARPLFLSVMDLLSRLTAHSNSSGLTPQTIASHFGPLLFGLGTPSSAFHYTYFAFLRAANATEHLLLAFIRLQEAQTQLKGAMPSRLLDWVRGYPSMIVPMSKIEKARPASKAVRVLAVRRNVRMYSPDLVHSAASWASSDAFASSKDWGRIAPAALKLPPRYSDIYRKRMNLPATFHPDMGSGAAPAPIIAVSPAIPPPDKLHIDLGGVTKDESRFRNLTDLKWGEFESIGFSSAVDKKLEFDLTESARKARSEKRNTLSWNDFSSTGFTRMDAPLSATLQFSTPIATTIQSWPSQSAELQRKLKKTQKALPPFGWDTTPVLGTEDIIEESFLDCFCDLVYGSGWMDRSETTFRDCNWALVEFKSMPQNRPSATPPGDPRTGSTLLLFEEFVPQEYREQLTAPKKRMRLFSSSAKSKAWKPAPTLNGRPYVVGIVPKSPSAREAEFEGLLRGGDDTKVLKLGRGVSTREHPPPRPLTLIGSPATDKPNEIPPVPPIPPLPSSSDGPPNNNRLSMFRIGNNNRRTAVMIPAEYDAVDFETRTASYSEGEGSGGEEPMGKARSRFGSALNKITSNGSDRRHSRRLSKDDAWVDILVADHNRRIQGQEAELPLGERNGSHRRLRSNRSDPELAREEIARALASVGRLPPDEFDPTPEPPAAPPGFRPSMESEDNYGPPEPPRESVYDGMAPNVITPEIRIRPPTMSTVASIPIRADHARSASIDSNDFEPMHSRPESSVIPEPVAPSEDEDPASHAPMPSYNVPRDLSSAIASDAAARAASPSNHLPPSMIPTRSGSLPTSQARQQAGGKGVASLIEMYREKERVGSPAGPRPVPGSTPENSPSRLPVRAQEARTPSPEPVSHKREEELGVESTERPGRYIHGAPLHNVLEEEDE